MEEKTCLECEYLYVEDIWYSCQCKKKHSIKIDDDGYPNTICEDFKEEITTN